MKTRNVILALSAIVFAVGSAFTTAKTAALENAYVLVRLVSTGAYVCRDTGFQCENTGTANCSISVFVDTPAPGHQDIVTKAFKSGCTAELKAATGTGIRTYIGDDVINDAKGFGE